MEVEEGELVVIVVGRRRRAGDGDRSAAAAGDLKALVVEDDAPRDADALRLLLILKSVGGLSDGPCFCEGERHNESGAATAPPTPGNRP